MMSSSDLPACPACGSREVRTVQDPPRTFYACAQCGRDRTEAWEAIQPPPAPEKTPKTKAFRQAQAFNQEAKERHMEEDLALGIGATLGASL